MLMLIHADTGVKNVLAVVKNILAVFLSLL